MLIEKRFFDIAKREDEEIKRERLLLCIMHYGAVWGKYRHYVNYYCAKTLRSDYE